ncbi:catechol 2,3-dioxygenase-like lactoylglutathione lyase family enzyme [Caulobacter rhizosphaerae]|uniref:Catechol 2,3-dioxygenase-like lactoylglutathione lyase family enzyme n=1 Tax=Caulobacter rhizosphaerae TaxID=2010972 RepID=A0ABU1MZW3_9CAUL|nr:VOC family protein [Caulobacter rhizosphaerae]MDR6531710.1 catechol 2,3-dioxygenase-like lactoylglutathione lyase family enzyme [Caulobacter rhizosphaerae]
MAQHLTLLSLLVRDYDEALAFYVGKMGFSLVEDSHLGGGKRWVVVAPGAAGTRFLLAKASDDQQTALVGGQGGGRVWLFLHTDAFEADHARLSAAGVRFLEAPRHEAYGSVAVFEDLYGNRWDLLQPKTKA